MSKSILLFFVAIFFISCGKDEEKVVNCAIDDFVGVWTFKDSKSCILTDTDKLTITKKGTNTIYGEYTGGGATSTFPNWTVSNCTFTGKIAQSGLIDVVVTGSLVDGNLTITNVGSFLGSNVNCTEKLVK